MFRRRSADRTVRTELIMKTLKDLERELILDWQGLDLIESSLARGMALKAYYLKYALYRKARSWQLELLSPVVPAVI